MTNRKLQTEIERVLKKVVPTTLCPITDLLSQVQEGLEIFDELYNKVYSAQSPQQKVLP